MDGKLFLTSFMLQPCINVTVTSQKGKSLIWNKTIQPLTRTILCDFDSLTDSIDNYSLTTDDAFYKTLSTIPTNWNISFNGFIRRVSTVKEDLQNTLKPVHAREWIALVYDMAYVIGLPEYEKRCYEAVENKELVTDDELSVYLTKEEMAQLLQKARNYYLILGRCNDGYGLGGGNTLWLSSGWILGIGAGKSWYDTHAFWHEFSHCMGWGHHHGNMCNLERPAPWGTQCWPSIAAKLYVEELEKGNPPYIEGESFFNSKLFSKDDINPLPVEDDRVQNDTLYIAEGMSYIDSHKNQKDFTKVHIPLSVEEIKPSALYGTNLTEITIPSYIRKIGAQAFKDCENLTKVTIEEGVKEIGNEAFLNSAITEIELPESVTVIGSNISSKNVLWVAKKGSLAYDYAVKNNYKIKFTQEELDEIASSILAEGKNAMAAPTDKWVTNTFTASEPRCKWDFSDQLKGEGDYTISFSFTGGESMLCIRDALVVADGKAIAYYQEKKTAGDNPKQILYSFTLPAGTKKLELYALARRSGNASSNGIMNIESLTDKSAKILKESASATAATETGWKANDFTTKYERRSWDFSMALEGAGEYKVTFTYTKGAHMLCLSEVIFTADGKAIACFPEERTAGTNPRRIVYNITLPKGCKKLEMFALARTSGGRDSHGSIEIKKTN
ncbi:MAG: leucine-rich repeat domain-containing protein [Treponemataceae bacterium]|nr:leucine-rich repeat domain-containing protein [Treponemataceae bacterium]